MKLISSLLAAAVMAGAPASLHAAAEVINGVQVVVHDSVITSQDVLDYTSKAEEELFRDYRRQPRTLEQKVIEVRRDGTEQLIERQLILHEFADAKLAVPQKYIDDEVEKRIRRAGDRMVLIKTLEQQGTTLEKERRRIRNRIIEEIMRRHNVSPEKIVISPHKIETYYQEHLESYKLNDRVKLRMISLNKPSGGDAVPVRKTAEEVLTKLNEGGSFPELAKQYSQGAQRSEGGLFGWSERSTLRKDLAESAFSLKTGQHSGIVEAPDGFYILQVDEAQPAHYTPLSEVHAQIEKDLLDSERSRQERQWIEKLKKKTFWRYF